MVESALAVFAHAALRYIPMLERRLMANKHAIKGKV
jgi:hypothetical protein